MTEEEKKQKLQEMMDDAKWRDEQRAVNVQRYKKEEKEREKKDQSSKGGAFLRYFIIV